jgi:regulatory protein
MTATTSEPPARRVIGALVPDPRRAGGVRVLVQGRPLLTVPREVVEAERLATGTELDEPLYARLCRAADEEAAFRTTLRFLERRPFACRNLARRLVLKGHPPEAAEAAIARAERAGLLNDAQFALHYIQTRSARGRGPQRLRRDLALLGVERAVVDRALAEAFGIDGVEAPSAEVLARKRLAQLKGLPRPVQRRRLLAYLARRGFAGEAVGRMVAGLLVPCGSG